MSEHTSTAVSRVCESPCKNTFRTGAAFVTRDTHFWCFPQVSSRDLSRPGKRYPPSFDCFDIYPASRGGTDSREKFCFLRNISCRHASLWSLLLARKSSSPAPRPKFLLSRNSNRIFPSISYSTMKEFQTVSRICPLLLLLFLLLFPRFASAFFFISRNNPPSNEKIPGNISLSNPRWLAVESKNLNNPVRVIHFHE